MKSHLANPFGFGTIVKNNKFCNRKTELTSLSNYIRDAYSVWLYSPRRYGKSSLIHRMMESKDIKCVYLDLYNVKSLDDFCRKYADAIARNLFSWDQELENLLKKLRRYFTSFKTSVSFDELGKPSLVLEKGGINEQVDVESILNVPAQIAAKSKKPICIAFDEFQEIKRIDPFLINWMRSAFQHHENISYVFLGSQQSLMEEIFLSDYSPFYEFAVKMGIGEISFEDWVQFIRQKFEENGLNIRPDVLEAILKKSDCHPHFTQYFASVVFDLVRAGIDQEQDGFNDLWVEKILQSQSLFFQDIYDQLTNVQRLVISAVAKMKEHEELFSSASRVKHQLPVSSSTLRALQSLIKRNLVLKNEGRYKLINPIFKEWLVKLP